MTKTKLQKKHPCKCKGRSGQKKTRFLYRHLAVSVAIRRGWSPSTYPCPSGAGFHLTHERY